MLSLGGTAADAPAIARLLQQVRSQLRTPLHEHFDMVAASGVGIFFVLMIFCKKAPIEECIHHLPGILHAKVTRHAFKFGRRLTFRRAEYRSNSARAIILSSPGDDPEAEARRLWPGCKIDVLLQYHGGHFEEAQVTTAADKLVASLFYVEPGQIPLLWPQSPVSIAVTVKCRLPPGPDLANLIMRLRMNKARVEFGGHQEARQLDLCPSFVWDRISAGCSFERVLYLRVASHDTDITCSIKVNGRSTASVYRGLSNCPVKLCDLIAAYPTCRVISQAKHAVVEKIDQMEDQLCTLLI